MTARYLELLALLLTLATACGGDNRGENEAGLGTWQTLAPMPTPRTEVAVAAVSFRIYVVGGFEADGSVSDKVEVYDSHVDKWAEVAPLPEPLGHAAAVEWYGQLTVFGGINARGVPSSRIYQYSPLTDEWIGFGSMRVERGALAVAMLRGSPYVIGGVKSASDGSLVNVATVETHFVDHWLRVEDIPTPRHHLAAAIVEGTVYAIGGRQQFDLSGNLDVNEAYGLEGAPCAWTSRAPLPTARSGIAAAALDGRIYVFGGEAPEATFDENEAYDPQTDAWATMAPMPTARHGLGAAVVEDTIYVIGGGPEPALSVTGANEAFKP